MTNGDVIEAEIGWFRRVLDRRLEMHAEGSDGDVLALPAPALPEGPLAYAQALDAAGLSDGERLVLILALLPHLRPQALDLLLIQNDSSKRRFTEFGGIDGGQQSGFRPTRETALFVLAGENMDRRLEATALFAPEAPLRARRILDAADEPGEAGPWLPLVVSQRWIGQLTSGVANTPRFGPAFPAQRLETGYDWRDLVLGITVREELEAMLAWARHERVLMVDMRLSRHLKPGYRALFHGPPGTGKTMTAAVLGKALDLPVYRVDLSRVVSKWIGETEKNLGALFDQAADGDILLFFDEADALFGKRGDTRSANDRHANQQIAYLLQRIEESPGVVILASNLKGNIDAAFARRFQSIVYFPVPDAEARLALWQAAFEPPRAALIEGVDLAAVARDYEISGGEIINVLRRFCVDALRDDGRDADARLRATIGQELANMGRLVG